MSWPLWNQAQAVPQVDMNMGAYTAEQWALMQQQNWEQWNQWQQQYSQWHGQYGDKYTEQMKNLSRTSGAAQPPLPPTVQSTDIPPPPPDNPPPQPVAAPGGIVQYNQSHAGYHYPVYNANVAPPAIPLLLSAQNIHSSVNTVQNTNYHKELATSGYSKDAQSRTAMKDFSQGQKSNVPMANRSSDKFNYNPKDIANSDHCFNNKTTAGDTYDQNAIASGLAGNTGEDNSRFFSTSDNSSSRNVPVASRSDSNSLQGKPDYAEEERLFDLQFKKWEEEFFKWKEHNIDHPDRAAYDEYEKTFETCRAQLLERKEQMRLRRMSERSTTVSQTSLENNAFPPQDQISRDDRFNSSKNQSFDATNNMHDDNPYLKGDSPEDCLADGSELFPKMYNSNDGIPGLDLVPDEEQEHVSSDSVHEVGVPATAGPQEPDFSAISKGIDNILGDKKLLQMLSAVRQKSGTVLDPSQTIHPSQFTTTRWNSGERENGADVNNVPMDTGNSPSNSPSGHFNQKTSNFQLPDMNKMPPIFNINRMPPNGQDSLNRMPYDMNQMPGSNFLNKMPLQSMDRMPPNRVPWNANQSQGNPPFRGQMNRMPGDFLRNRPPLNMNQMQARPNLRNFSGNTAQPPPLLSLPVVRPNMMNSGASPNIPPHRGPNYSHPSNNDNFETENQPFASTDAGMSLRESEMAVKGSEVPSVPAVPVWVNQPILEPVIIVDYEHKSDKFSDYDFLEPVKVFDYSHLHTEKSQGEPGRMPDVTWDRTPVPGRPRPYNERLQDTNINPRNTDVRFRDTDIRSKDTDARFKDPDIRSKDTDGRAREFEARSKDYLERGSNYSQRYNRSERNPERDRDYSKRDERSRYRNDDERGKDTDRGRYRDRSYDRRDRYDRRSNSRERSSGKKAVSKSKSGDVIEIIDLPVEIIEIPDDDIVGNTIVMIDDLLETPGREVRPRKIAIILRGLPGSGKSYLAKLIKDREIENGGSDLRVLSLDDYFISEVENSENNSKNQTSESKYQYDKSMEKTYITLLQKSFRRTVSEGFFSFIIVDSVNDQLHHFDDMFNAAKSADFKVYMCEMDPDPQSCFKRNIHDRTLEEIQALSNGWQESPDGSNLLDATTLLQTAGIDHVQMEDVSDQEMPDNEETHPNQEDEVPSAFYSKWDRMDDTDKLALLDGTSKPLRHSASTMEDFLQLDDWDANKSAQPGKKTVRWADIEERREQEKMRAIGFVVGQTNWQRMTDPTQGSAALTQTKYIERVTKKY